jgi:hypothetical protein
MSGPPVPVPPIYLPGGLDCSDPAQALRLRALADLQARYYGGVAQVSDRNRSVTYQSPDQMLRGINALVGQIQACQAGAWPRKPARVYYVPQVKDL